MSEIISVHGVCKKYKSQDRYALKDINFTVEEGEIIGVLGPNGAGKSILIKILLGVIRHTEGQVQVMGKDPMKFGKKEKSRIGVFLGGKTNLVFHLPVMDSIRLFQKIYKVPEEVFQKNLKHYAQVLQCEEFLQQRVATLSLGQKLRAELLCILIYEPSLLILDEPTLGLDIEGKKVFRETLRKLVEEKNMSVLITTHDVSDMERLCSRIMMICSGEKILDLTDKEFEVKLMRYVILVTDCSLEGQGIRLLESAGKTRRYLVEKTALNTVKKSLLEQECSLMQEETPRLEDLFYEYYS